IRSQLDRFAQIFEGVEDDILCDGAAGLAALQATLAAALSAKLARNVMCVDVPPDFQGI
ncbi:MAG TPA: gfo/Idh/MocA family oxidoreductase, partial [Alphaproteobacteria bacterium]|nr:gfo/Idh/MocA family oxidoreductase [Alphaproteobacteria bacterium]